MVDVAKHAGVSKSTISHYLNGRFARMSPETKERIAASIEALDYTPSPIARSLNSSRTNTIGVIVRDITGYFTSRVIRGIDDYCKKYKYDVLIYNTDFDPEIEKQSLKKLRQLRVDGIIIASSGRNNELLAKQVDEGFPTVLLHLEFDDLNANIVLSDNKQGSFDATEHLIKLGHKRICLHTLNYQSSRSRRERVAGYTEALEKYGLPVDPSLIHLWSRDTGMQTPTADILNSENPPTAFLSLYLAITDDLLNDFKQLDVNLPDDISLIGFDEIPMVEHFKVPVTVVAQSPYEMGVESARILLDGIANEGSPITRSVLPCRLIERESCGEPRLKFE